jgi:hypothetical protein
VGIIVIVSLYFNYRYHTVSVPYTITVVTIVCQIIDGALGRKTPIPGTTAENTEM